MNSLDNVCFARIDAFYSIIILERRFISFFSNIAAPISKAAADPMSRLVVCCMLRPPSTLYGLSHMLDHSMFLYLELQQQRGGFCS